MNTEPAWTNQSVKTKSDAMDINGPTCLQPTHSTSKHNDTIQITRRLFFLSSSFLAARKYCEPLRTIHWLKRSSHQVTLLAADVTLVGGFPLIRIHVYTGKHVGHIISLTFDIHWMKLLASSNFLLRSSSYGIGQRKQERSYDPKNTHQTAQNIGSQRMYIWREKPRVRASTGNLAMTCQDFRCALVNAHRMEAAL